jgi:uncharacterized protein (DUF2384 family)
MESIASIGRFMGGKQVIGSPQSEHDLIAVIRKGLPSSAIAAITKSSDMSEDAIYQSLRIAKRTVARRKATTNCPVGAFERICHCPLRSTASTRTMIV